MFFNPCQGRSIIPKSFVHYLPPPSYELHPEEPLEVDTVPFGLCIEGVARMMLGFLRKKKREMMVAESFVLFFTVKPELNGGI